MREVSGNRKLPKLTNEAEEKWNQNHNMSVETSRSGQQETSSAAKLRSRD